MYDLVQWLNNPGEVHPVLASGIAQFQLVHIHPFNDGNGRTSRLLSTLYLYRAGYDFKRLFTISEYYDRDRSDFYTALQSVRETDMDLTGWLEYFVTGLATQLDEVKVQGALAIQADAIGRDYDLNERQISLFIKSCKRTTCRLDLRESVPEHESKNPATRPQRLDRQGSLFSEGATNQLSYRLNRIE